MPFNSDNPNEHAVESEVPTGDATSSNSPEQENSPFIVGAESGGETVIGEDEPSKRSHSGTLLIILVILLAGAGLFSMRTLGRVSAAGNVDNDLEATIEAFLTGATSGNRPDQHPNVTELVERNKQVLDVIRKSDLENKFTASDLQRNPFIIGSPREIGSEDNQPDASKQTAAREQQRAKRRTELTKAIQQVKIKSILMGSQPLVNINDNVLTEGDQLDLKMDNAAFHIVDIQSASATIEGIDETLDVSVKVDLALKRR